MREGEAVEEGDQGPPPLFFFTSVEDGTEARLEVVLF